MPVRTPSPKTSRHSVGQSWLGSTAELNVLVSGANVSFTDGFSEHEPSPTHAATRYQQISLLGKGGMGQVWLGWDAQLERHVAIKEPLGDARSRQAQHLTYEAMISARLEHPAIISIHDVFFVDERPHFVMKLIRGRPLSELIADHHERSDAPLDTALIRHVLSACEAVGYAHKTGVLHRDISPMNVLAGEDGATHVIDWGLAVTLTDLQDHPGYVGTPGYIAPEQQRGETSLTRSDVWSLGALLHDVMYGVAPGDASEHADTSRHPELQAIITCATHHDPSQRYAHAAEMADDLNRWFEGQRVQAYKLTPINAIKRLARVYALPITIGVLVLLVLSGAIIWGVVNTRQEAQRARRAELMAIDREQEVIAENTRAQQAIAELLLRDAASHAERRELFDAERLASKSLQHHDNPGARGLLSVLATSARPTSKLLYTLPECAQGSWELTDDTNTAICHATVGYQSASEVKVWHNGSWLWTKEWDPRVDYACGIKYIHADAQHIYVDHASHQSCGADFIALDLYSGERTAEDYRKGILISSQHTERLNIDRTALLDYPSTTNTCTSHIIVAEFAANSELIYVCDDYQVWSVSKNHTAQKLDISADSRISALTAGPDGRTWAANSEGDFFTLDRSKRSWKIGEPVKSIVHIQGTELLAVLGIRGTLRVFDTAHLDWLITLPGSHKDVRSERRGVLRALEHNFDVSAWTFHTPTHPGHYETRAGISALAWSADQRHIASLDGNGHVHMFSPEDGTHMPEQHWIKGAGKSITPSHQKNLFYMVGIRAGGVHTLNATTTAIDHYNDAFTGMHSRIFTSHRDDLVALTYGKRSCTYKPHDQPTFEKRDLGLRTTSFDGDTSADGKHLIIISKSNVSYWDWDSPAQTFHPHQTDIKSGSVNARGEVVLAEYNALLVFDAQRALTAKIPVAGDKILDVDWIPGKPWVALGKFDGSASIWDVSTQKELLTHRPHSGRVAKLEASPDGKWLATSSWDGSVIVWDLGLVERPRSAIHEDVAR